MPFWRSMLLLLAFPACDRAESYPGGGATPAHPSESVTPSPAQSARPEPRCVVPLPDVAPPRAEPAAECPADPGPVPVLSRGWVTFTEAPGSPRIAVEVATDPRARERGLMYRTALPEDQGMIFSWPGESIRSFWMRNTCIPLDMFFIAADGTIAGILENVPTMNQASRSIPCPAAHVLELTAGSARGRGIAPGQHVVIEN